MSGDPQGAEKASRITAGRITSTYGVKGWVKVHSQSEPIEAVLNYKPWYVKTAHGLKVVEIEQGKRHGKGLIAKLPGVETPEDARLYCQSDFEVEIEQFPGLEEGDYYWHQLVGLRVISRFGDQDYDLGTVTKMMETGANDVLVVKGDQQAIDRRERLLPYVPEQFITAIDLANGTLWVDWDPEF